MNFSAAAHFGAIGSTFSLTQVYLNGTALGVGDLSGNTFNTSLYVPESDVQDLSASPNGVANSNNAAFDTVDIEAGNVPSGQTLTLNAIGTATAANLVYAFPSGFTVSSGGTMNVGPVVNVQIPANQTLTDNGSVSFGTGDAVSFTSVYGSTTVINVTGSLTANGTSFTSTGSTSQLNFTGGAHFGAIGSTFALTQVSLGGARPGCGRHVGQHLQLPVLRARVGRCLSVGIPHRTGQ